MGRLVPCPGRWSVAESTSSPATTWCRYQPSRERTLSTFCASGNRKGFLSSWLSNIKQKLAENKEMNENIKKKKSSEMRPGSQEEIQNHRIGNPKNKRGSQERNWRRSRAPGRRALRKSFEVILAKTTEPSAELLSKAGEKLDRTAASTAPCQGVKSF